MKASIPYTEIQNLLARKKKTLTMMNNLVCNFAPEYENTPAHKHIDGYWAVAILEDYGDEGGADGYRYFHAKLMELLKEEEWYCQLFNSIGIKISGDEPLDCIYTQAAKNKKILSAYSGTA